MLTFSSNFEWTVQFACTHCPSAFYTPAFLQSNKIDFNHLFKLTCIKHRSSNVKVPTLDIKIKR